MTQTVLQNEITELTPKSGVKVDQRRSIANALGDVLADAFRLFINTQGLHWNVEGPMFYSLHKITESQYESLGESLDRIAERIRALGLPAPESIDEYKSRSVVEDLPRKVELQARVERLVHDYEQAVIRATRTAELAEEVGDIRSVDLLTRQVGDYEESAWMLRATIAS